MNKKIIAFSLAFVVLCGIFAGCKKKNADPVSVYVTDESGMPVTDKNGEPITKIAEVQTDKDGNAVTEKATNAKGQVVTDKNGKEQYVIVTEGDGSTTKQKATVASPDKVPYSTTAPDANKTLDEWTFGNLSKVGCYAPTGWKNEAVNQVVKDGTNIRVTINPKNYLSEAGYKNADEYAKFLMNADKDKAKQVSYQKEVYKDGMGIAYLQKFDKVIDNGSGIKYGKYNMIYIFQTGKDVRVYFVYGDNEKQAKTSIADVIANTYYRG